MAEPRYLDSFTVGAIVDWPPIWPFSFLGKEQTTLKETIERIAQEHPYARLQGFEQGWGDQPVKTILTRFDSLKWRGLTREQCFVVGRTPTELSLRGWDYNWLLGNPSDQIVKSGLDYSCLPEGPSYQIVKWGLSDARFQWSEYGQIITAWRGQLGGMPNASTAEILSSNHAAYTARMVNGIVDPFLASMYKFWRRQDDYRESADQLPEFRYRTDNKHIQLLARTIARDNGFIAICNS